MAAIIIEDDLINKVLEIGQFKTAEQAVVAILSEYIKTYSSEIDTLYLDVDRAARRLG